MIRKSMLAVVCVAVLAACGMFKRSTPKLEDLPPTVETATEPTKEPLPNQADVDRVQDKFPGYTLDEFNRGKSLYEANCASCHSLEEPSSESEEEWRSIVPRMVVKVNKRSMNPIDAAGEEVILRYLITMCSVSGR